MMTKININLFHIGYNKTTNWFNVIIQFQRYDFVILSLNCVYNTSICCWLESHLIISSFSKKNITNELYD